MAPADGSDSEEGPEEGSDSGGKSGSGKGVIVLEQEDHRIPSREEVLEYAEYLGIDVEREKDLLWIAEKGVTAPVPSPWKACTENGDDIFYFNFDTGESIWDHPSDEQYKKLLQEKRLEKSAAKIVRTSKTPGDAAGSGLPSASADESFSASGSMSNSDKGLRSVEAEKEQVDSKAHSSRSNSKEAKEAKDAKDPGMPSKGLAGVGLAGARLEVPTAPGSSKKEPRDVGVAKKGEASAESIEEEEGLDVSASRSGTRGSSKGSRKDGEPAEVEPQRSGSVGAIAVSDASELSEDFMSDMGSPNSSFVPGVGVTRVRSNSVGGDTLELSLSASAITTGDVEDLPPAQGGGQGLEAEVASLARSLTVLKRIRESQKKYLELLLHGGAVKG